MKAKRWQVASNLPSSCWVRDGIGKSLIVKEEQHGPQAVVTGPVVF